MRHRVVAVRFAAQLPHHATDPDRAVEDRPQRQHARRACSRPSAPRPTDAMQPHCVQSGSPPYWHGVIVRFRSDDRHVRRLREDALVGILRRRAGSPARPTESCRAASAPARRARSISSTTRCAILGPQHLRRLLALLRRVEAEPDALDVGQRRPELRELGDVARPATAAA